MKKLGVYKDISIEDYHSNKDHFSSTQIKQASISLKHFKVYIDNEDKERKSCFDFGNAFECALLTPDEFDEKVKIFDPEERPDKSKSFGSSINKGWKASFFDSDKYIINKDGLESFEIIEEMLKSCHADRLIQSIIKDKELEVQNSFYYRDKNTGIYLKSRPDALKKDKYIIDVKTTNDGSPYSFYKDLCNYGYELQATMQIRGVIETGYFEKIPKYYWLVVEKKAPYSATLYEFDRADIDIVSDYLDDLLYKISKGIKDNFYPSYSNKATNDFGILAAKLPYYKYE